MAKIDLMLTSGLTATDGSFIASGATLKFNSEFYAGITEITIKLRLYRNRVLFESGYTNTECIEFPHDLVLDIPEEEYYVITPLQVYEKVGEAMNEYLGGEYFELIILE